MDFERVILDNLPLVDEVVAFIARRHRLSADEKDDLRAAARLKLLENDYEVLRRFEGRSSIRTYLTTVIQRHFLDQRIAAWGKWRPSSQARRLGPVAVELDRLLTRDGLSFDEAVAVMTSRPDATASLSELQAIVVQLPQRSRRRFLGEEELERLAVAPDPEADVIHALDQSSDAERIEQALAAALEQLGPQDRLILKLRFRDNVQVSRIARLLDLPQKPLYRRIDDVFRTLRRELEARGVRQQDVAAILGHPAAELRGLIEAEPARNPEGSPSVP